MTSTDFNTVDELDLEAGRGTGEQFYNLEVLEERDHPMIPDIGHDYWERGINDDVTDLETVTKVMDDRHFCTLLEGETGTGKNTLIDFICQQTNRPRIRVNFGVDVTYEELVGHYAPNEEGHFTRKQGTLKWAVKNGAVFIADELNGAEGEATMPLHAIAEAYHKRELVDRETGEVLKPFPDDMEWSEEYKGDYIHPEFKFVATMNPVGYSGTKDLNQAFQNRFIKIPVPYLDPSEEVEFLIDQTSLDEVHAQGLIKLANRLRQRHKENDIETPVSTRDLMKVAKMAEIMPVKQATHTILTGMANYNDEAIISGVIDKHDI